MDRKGLIEEMTAFRFSLFGYALWLSKDRDVAEDLVQETFARSLQSIDNFQPGTNVEAWMITILRNYHFKQRRGAKVWARETAEDIHDCEDDPVLRTTWSAEDGLILRDALDKLNVQRRRALLCVLAYGNEYSEAASLLGCRTGTVKSRVNRAREELVGLLTGGHYANGYESV